VPLNVRHFARFSWKPNIAASIWQVD
jgi:hypothetical protein